MPLSTEEFRQPSLEYAGAPFWSWNDRLSEKELIRQIRYMKGQGWGGFFMHARGGLVTPYLSRDWMARIRACVQEAREQGMHAWLYDENKWPSGFAGGKIPRMGARYRSKSLICHLDTKEKTAFEGRFDGKEWTDLQRVAAPSRPVPPEPKFGAAIGDRSLAFPVPEAEEMPRGPLAVFRDASTRISFHVRTDHLGNPWFNGTSYVDLLDPRVTEAFIESTYEEYRKEVGTAFGYAVPGIFTDEPCYTARNLGGYGGLAVPWTTDFPREFKEQNGYDIVDHLVSLFFDVGDYNRVRFHFWSTLSDLFVRSYTRKIFDWCERNNLKMTGHFLHEDSLLAQLENIGAAMPHYEYMQQPGIDFLTRTVGYTGEGLPGPALHGFGVLTAKQCTSVSHQLGKTRTLSELYGCSGQNMNFEDRRWIGDWHLIHGVNFLNQHLSLYSMRGERKRDFPPNIFHQQPWWKYTRVFEDYQTRLCYALTKGQRQTDVLLLHPIGSAWAAYKPSDTSKVLEMNAALNQISVWLLQSHMDFDFGDEKILAKYGATSDGVLRIGNQTYTTVVIPPSLTWQDSTVQFLKRFLADGGKVLAVEPFPTMIEGQRSDELIRWLKKAGRVHLQEEMFKKAVRSLVHPPFDLRGWDGDPLEFVWYHLRKDEDGREILFLANVHKHKGFEGQLVYPAGGSWEEWDAVTGEVKPRFAVTTKRSSRLDISLAPTGSVLLVRDPKTEKTRLRRPRKWRPLKDIELDPAWKIRRNDPNAYLLDYCLYQISVEDEVWSEPVPVLMAQDYYKGHPEVGRYRICYFVELDYEPSSKASFTLAIELPPRSNMTVNDRPVDVSRALAGKTEYWRDISWRTVDLKKRLKKGVNRIELSGRWSPEVELEAAYLLGDFTVRHEDRTRFWLEKEGITPRQPDLVDRGYPFFTGEMVLSQEISLPSVKGRRATLEFNQLGATVAVVSVNGREAGSLYWRPYTLDITEFIKRGRNRIDIKLVTSLFNLLGPHHHREGEIHGVGPGSFRDMANWVDPYFFVRLGPENARIRIWR